MARGRKKTTAASASAEIAGGEVSTATPAERWARLSREQKQQAVAFMRRFGSHVPQSMLKEWTNRQSVQFSNLERLYGVPMGRNVVDLGAVLRGFMDWFANNARNLKMLRDAEERGDMSPMRERLTEEKWKLARLDRREREQELLERGRVHEALVSLASRLRSFGETLQRRFGQEAHELLDELLIDYQAEMERTFGSRELNQPADSDPLPAVRPDAGDARAGGS